MTRFLIIAALACGVAGQAGAEAYRLTSSGDTLVVSCFRGPWKDVIWDRPNANFIDSLVSFGYDYPTAHAIGERVCRDERLVGNLDGMKAEMVRIYRDSPQVRSGRRRLSN